MRRLCVCRWQRCQQNFTLVTYCTFNNASLQVYWIILQITFHENTKFHSSLLTDYIKIFFPLQRYAFKPLHFHSLFIHSILSCEPMIWTYAYISTRPFSSSNSITVIHRLPLFLLTSIPTTNSVFTYIPTSWLSFP